MTEAKKRPGYADARDTMFKRRAHQQRLKGAAAAPGQRSDAELIAEALAAGRVTKCPPAEAQGALKWYTGTNLSGSTKP